MQKPQSTERLSITMEKSFSTASSSPARHKLSQTFVYQSIKTPLYNGIPYHSTTLPKSKCMCIALQSDQSAYCNSIVPIISNHPPIQPKPGPAGSIWPRHKDLGLQLVHRQRTIAVLVQTAEGLRVAGCFRRPAVQLGGKMDVEYLWS